MTPKKKNDDALTDDLLDKLLEGSLRPEDLIGKEGILKQPTGRLVDRGHVGRAGQCGAYATLTEGLQGLGLTMGHYGAAVSHRGTLKASGRISLPFAHPLS